MNANLKIFVVFAVTIMVSAVMVSAANTCEPVTRDEERNCPCVIIILGPDSREHILIKRAPHSEPHEMTKEEKREMYLEMVKDMPTYKPDIERALSLGCSRKEVQKNINEGLLKSARFWLAEAHDLSSRYPEWGGVSDNYAFAYFKEKLELLRVLRTDGLDSYIKKLP